MSLLFEGQVAIVTGGGRGIGRATAEALGRAGAAVVIAARSEDELQDTARVLSGEGVRCLSVPTDIADESQCEHLIQETVRAFGRLDILVNNAGAARFAPIWELSTEAFNLNLDVNLRGTFFCCRAAVRQMMPLQRGAIVNVASTSGKKPYETQAAYCAAKAGLIALSKVMALELRPYGIRVHTVSPGGVDTRLAAEIHPHREKVNWIQPEDVASGILYLLSTPDHIAVDELVIRRFAADPV